jgi:hypothetical protein
MTPDAEHFRLRPQVQKNCCAAPDGSLGLKTEMAQNFPAACSQPPNILDDAHNRVDDHMAKAMSWSRQFRGIGCHHDYVGSTVGMPQIADDLLQSPSRQGWAGSCC